MQETNNQQQQLTAPLTAVLHASIPLLSKRLGIWSQNAAKAGLQVVKMCCICLVDGATVSVGNSLAHADQTTSTPSAYCHLQHTGWSVTFSEGGSACCGPVLQPARATADSAPTGVTGGPSGQGQLAVCLHSSTDTRPLGKHQVLPATWLEPPPAAAPTVSTGARGQKCSLAGPSARQQQQQQGGALLPPPKRRHVDAAAATAAAGSSGAAAAGGSQQAAGVAAVGGGLVTGADGTLALDAAAAAAAAAVATQQVSGTAKLSSVTADALRSYVSMRAWVPAVHCSSGGGVDTSGSGGVQRSEPIQRQSAEGGEIAPRASQSQQQQVGWEHAQQSTPASRGHHWLGASSTAVAHVCGIRSTANCAVPRSTCCCNCNCCRCCCCCGHVQAQQLSSGQASAGGCEWGSTASPCFKVVSYNLLADKFIHGG